MPFLVAALLVVAVHLATAITAWHHVGLLADDHEMIGAAVLRHLGEWSFGSMFGSPAVEPVESVRALYRPFVDLLFWLEQPWFGIDAFGYHVVNSAMHCGTALVWFVLVRRLSGSVAAALATAVLFVGWPGHSEATHWISARVTLQSTFFLSLALLVHDVALRARGGAARWSLLGVAAVIAAVAVGSKESGVFVWPLAAVLSWHRAQATSSVAARARAAAVTAAPMLLVLGAWLWWRAACLGTWGSGTQYGWRFARIGGDSCADWLAVLLAPVHHGHAPANMTWLLAVLHTAVVVPGLFAMRFAAARAAVGAGALLLAMGYVAGIGLHPIDLPTLENVRYTYEPALGLCVLAGLGVAALPFRARGAALAVLVAVHALALDQNRRSWLGVSAVDQRMRTEVVDFAHTTQRPIRVFDAPGVYDGAFAWLNGYVEFLFLQRTAPPGTNLRGAVASTVEWAASLREIAAAAAAQQPLADTFTVRWDDGGLVPFTLDPQWPLQPWDGTSIAYARVARVHPFVDSMLPVHVLLQSTAPLRLHVEARGVATSWSGPAVEVAGAASAAPAPIALAVSLPATLTVGEEVAIDLVVERGSERRAWSLGVVVTSARR